MNTFGVFVVDSVIGSTLINASELLHMLAMHELTWISRTFLLPRDVDEKADASPRMGPSLSEDATAAL